MVNTLQTNLCAYTLMQVRNKFWPVMLTNWAVWPIANLINFAYIPPSQRILYVNVLAVSIVPVLSFVTLSSSTGELC
jgi:hypothetical protein